MYGFSKSLLRRVFWLDFPFHYAGTRWNGHEVYLAPTGNHPARWPIGQLLNTKNPKGFIKHRDGGGGGGRGFDRLQRGQSCKACTLHVNHS